jgi:hypothetical protein
MPSNQNPVIDGMGLPSPRSRASVTSFVEFSDVETCFIAGMRS